MAPIVYVGQNNGPDEWENKAIECVAACSKVPDMVTVALEPIVKRKIAALMKKYTNREWLAYLLGKEDEPHVVLDIIIPDQVATSGNVTDIEFDNARIPEGMKMLGVIHSHHNMTNIGFSGTDDAWINQNHDISILVDKEKITGQVRFITPCGARKLCKARFVDHLVVEFDEAAFEKEADERIKFSKPFVQRQGWDGWDGYFGGDERFPSGVRVIPRHATETESPTSADPDIEKWKKRNHFQATKDEIAEMEKGVTLLEALRRDFQEAELQDQETDVADQGEINGEDEVIVGTE